MPWSVIIQTIMRWAGAASIGYFANDATSAAGKIFGIGANKDTGKFPWWLGLSVILILTIVLFLIIKMFSPSSYRRGKTKTQFL